MWSRLRRHSGATAILGAVLTAVACSNVPQGFDSGTSDASSELATSPEIVYAAALDVLRTRGDVVEEERQGGGGILRTGRFRVEVELRADGATRLEVHVQRYVGIDHQAQARATLAEILDAIR